MTVFYTIFKKNLYKALYRFYSLKNRIEDPFVYVHKKAKIENLFLSVKLKYYELNPTLYQNYTHKPFISVTSLNYEEIPL